MPLYAAVFGVSLAEAGLLLAANRLVRIVGYGWVARFYETQGPRSAFILAVLGAACATGGYAGLPGVWGLLPARLLPARLLPARLLWGLSFAALNNATQAMATGEASGAARRSGLSRAIIATGPMIGLLAGAVLAELAGPRLVFACLGLLSLLALPFAMRLPRGEGARLRAGGPRFAQPKPLDVWSFVQGLTLDGLFVLGLSFLAAATVAEGAALSARFLAEVLLGPPAGRLAGRVGSERLLLMVSLGSAAGLAVIGAGWLWIGSLVVVGFRGLLQPLPAPVAAARAPAEERIAALARLATWRDIGAGLGPLAAGVLLPLVPALRLYLGAAGLLFGASDAALRR